MKLRDVAKCWASVTVKASSYPKGQLFQVYAPRRQRALYGVFGKLGHLSPVVLFYRGKKRRALKLQERIKRWGYADVRIQREKKKRGG